MYNHRGKAGFKRDWLGRKTEHYIRSEVLNKLVLDTIKEVSEYVKFNEEEFIKKVYSTSKEQQEKTSKLLKKRLAKEEKRDKRNGSIIIDICRS